MKVSLQARIRAFQIWQKLGYNPWKRPRTSKNQKKGEEGGEFYKGAFDSIPFLNDDAKRTFVHLLLRPGYMIRDYINGKHDRYLAPLTALIVFYAFFSLISAALQPLENKKDDKTDYSIEFEDSKKDDAKEESTLEVTPEAIEEAVAEAAEDAAEDEEDAEEAAKKANYEKAQNSLKGLNLFVKELRLLPHLDEHPEAVDSRPKAIIAAVEGSLRSKGITLFLGQFLLLWLSMRFCLRKQKVSWSAAAAASAYILCQFCFFMFFAVLLTWGHTTSIGTIVQALILIVDYRQWLSLSWRQSLGRTIKTGIIYYTIYVLFWILVGVSIVAVAWAKGLFRFSDFL